MVDSQTETELREAQARIKELEKQNRMLELKSKLYAQERKMLSANVAVSVVNAFRTTVQKEEVKVREALEEAVVDWLAKHDALDAIDLKAGAHNKVADDKVDEDKDTEDNAGEDIEGAVEEVEDSAEATELGTVPVREAVELEAVAVDEPSATLPMPRPDYNL